MKVSGGQKLAIVPLDNEKMNPFELLLERFFDPVNGTLVSNEIFFCSSLGSLILQNVGEISLPRIFASFCSFHLRNFADFFQTLVFR